MGNSRKHAIELGAVPLGTLLTSAGFSTVLVQLTAAQMNQLQRYLDAAVMRANGPRHEIYALSLADGLHSDAARAEVERIAREVLTNPVIEEYSFRLE